MIQVASRRPDRTSRVASTARAAVVAAGLLTASIASNPQSIAQSPVLLETYGRGVHAYHAGRLDEATLLLTQAIDNRLDDPRAYYFRGLAAMSQGMTVQAEEDFRAGGELEATGRYGDAIGRALTRVQGSARLRLEAIRDETRLAALSAANAASDRRYRELPGATAPITPPAAVAAPPAVATPPAVSAPSPAAPAAPIQPPTAPIADDPFADDLSEPMVDAADALEGADAPMGNDAAPAATPPAGGGDPLGGDAPAADPFGAPAGGGAAPADDPFATPAGGDPFGAPAGGDDPFGGAMGDDPFGN